MSNSIHPIFNSSARVVARAAAGLFLVLLLGGAPPVAAFDLDLLSSETDVERVKTIDHLAVQTRDGVVLLARWYIKGSMTPLPDPVIAEFLHARATHSGDAEWRDAAQAMTGSWAGLHHNDYLKWGAVDSLRSDIPRLTDGAPRRFKSVTDEAGLLSLFTMAWQASGKEMFRRAATRTADDLLGWSLQGETFRSWTSNEPDTLMGPAATADDAAWTAAKMLEASIVFKEPRFGPAWLARRVQETAPANWNPEQASSSPADTIAAARASLAWVRYARWTHADSLFDLAESCLDSLSLAATQPTRDMPIFAARAAAGLALELIERPSVMAYIVGDSLGPATRELAEAAVRAWRPGRLVQVRSADATDLLYPASGDGTPLAYVCSGELCAPPTSDPDEVASLIRSFALPDPPAATATPGQ